MLADVIDALRCPHCREAFTLDCGTARCASGHAFDVARQGHLNLVAGRPATTGDTADMVAARADFLATGNYQPIRDALAKAAAGRRRGLAVEVGAGTAYYLAGVVGDGAGVALDVSPYAARRAAKAHPRIGSVQTDAWQALPVRDRVADVVLSVFAPRNPAEIARILTPDGVLLVVTPNQPHLRELVGALGLIGVDEHKDRRLRDSLGARFARTAATELTWAMELDRRAVGQLVAMGPSAWHTDAGALAARVAELAEPVAVTASVTVSAWCALSESVRM
ncbi:MAG TPA: methyltransferase domain-containing protein [Kribbellaceae bacterium]